jgi:hypothetical protein
MNNSENASTEKDEAMEGLKKVEFQKIKNRLFVQDILHAQLEILASKSKKCEPAELIELSSVMLSISQYLYG